jgi:hypothetical protein
MAASASCRNHTETAGLSCSCASITAVAFVTPRTSFRPNARCVAICHWISLEIQRRRHEWRRRGRRHFQRRFQRRYGYLLGLEEGDILGGYFGWNFEESWRYDFRRASGRGRSDDHNISRLYYTRILVENLCFFLFWLVLLPFYLVFVVRAYESVHFIHLHSYLFGFTPRLLQLSFELLNSSASFKQLIGALAVTSVKLMGNFNTGYLMDEKNVPFLRPQPEHWPSEHPWAGSTAWSGP